MLRVGSGDLLQESGDERPQPAEDGEEQADRQGRGHERVAFDEGQDQDDHEADREVGQGRPEALRDEATEDRNDPLLCVPDERGEDEHEADTEFRREHVVAGDVQAERGDPDDHPEAPVAPMGRQVAPEREAEDETGDEEGMREENHGVLQRVSGWLGKNY